jgi:hypothetical protein
MKIDFVSGENIIINNAVKISKFKKIDIMYIVENEEIKFYKYYSKAGFSSGIIIIKKSDFKISTFKILLKNFIIKKIN